MSSAQWGFHPGGWGKPPMDDFNRPLYGDVFGVLQGAELGGQEQIDRSLWGEIEPIEGRSIPLPCVAQLTFLEDEEEEEEDDEDEEEEMPEDEEPAGGLETPSGMATPSGMHSVTSTVPAGLETPAFADLRKKRREDSEAPAPGPSQPRDLYQVIPERETSSKGFMGSSSAYDMSSVGAGVLGAEDLGKKASSPLPILRIEADGLAKGRRCGRFNGR